MTKLGSVRAARIKVASAALVIAGILGTGAMISTAVLAQETDQKTVSPDDKKVAAGEREAKKLLLLMDTDKSGKVSKQEFMAFMEAEFERMDINKDGELEVKELTNSRVQVRTRGR
jgi:Ca2+-binding EF-hand superfamily protein